MKTLLHCCCGPCTAGSLPAFLERGREVTGWYFNPNIHPYKEFTARRDSFIQYMQAVNCEYLVENEYPLEDWLLVQAPLAKERQARCGNCYRLRLEPAAQKAAELGYDAYSTTLLVSPYQDHQLLIEVGQEMALRYGVSFDYIDLRPGFRDGQNQAREMGLYMQKYCGCIYSEKERYVKKKKKAAE